MFRDCCEDVSNALTNLTLLCRKAIVARQGERDQESTNANGCADPSIVHDASPSICTPSPVSTPTSPPAIQTSLPPASTKEHSEGKGKKRKVREGLDREQTIARKRK